MTESPRPPSKELLPRVAFFVACLFFACLYGVIAQRYGWFPSGLVSGALDQLERSDDQPDLTTHHVHRARHELAGVRRYGDGAAKRDVVLLTSFWPDEDDLPGLRLIDRDGAVLHHWRVDPSAIWPESPHRDAVAGLFNQRTNYIHGSYLFPNGDVVFNIEFLGLVRMNAAGEVVWKLGRRTHHSVTRDHNGDFWVCAVRWVETEAQRNGRFAGLTLPLAEDYALKVSADGEVLQEVSMLETVYDSRLKDLLWRVGKFKNGDILHLNDVDVLTEAMAASYPQFSAGDLLVSLRHLDCVFVVDPATREVKWAAHEPFMNQHDPDFVGDGTITVFDNHNDGSLDGSLLGGSRLWSLRPGADEVRQLYPTTPPASAHERSFYTQMGGKAQLLADGHWLLTEAQYGRVFEIDADGATTWEWGHQRRGDGVSISEVLEGTSYTLSEAELAALKSH